MKNIGLYIHIPFCKKKCGYCDFYSLTNLSLLKPYVEAIKESIVYYKKKYQDKNISSIFFGGGTPSMLEKEDLAEILNIISDNFHIEKDAEITTEANPEHISKEFVKYAKNAGVNRFSFGVQSAIEKELLVLDRQHRNHHVTKAVDFTLQAGIKNFSFDIIEAIPYQTISSINKTLDFLLSFPVKHISAYILTLEEKTPLYLKKDDYLFLDEDEQADIYLYVANYLEERKFLQYEVSNFAKKGYESKHNLTYWEGKQYLGIGPSAHSFIDGKRFFYKSDIKEFINMAKNKEHKIIQQDLGGGFEEYVMLNMRLSKGINLIILQSKYNLTKENISRIKANAETLKKYKLANFENNKISLTKEGFLTSNLCISNLLENVEI